MMGDSAECLRRVLERFQPERARGSEGRWRNQLWL